MQTVFLTVAEFGAAFVEPMRNITGDEQDAIDIWPYYEAISQSDLKPFAIKEPYVESVYRSGDNRFDHVLIPTTTKNVYLVIVVALNEQRVVGHHVLNLNEKYGLETPTGLN